LHRLRVHLVWTPKYRRSLLSGEVSRRVEELLRHACVAHEWEVLELSVQVDHIHLLLQITPSVSVSRVMNILKGGSSRRLRLEFPELEDSLWGASFWCDGYFVDSVGQLQESVVRRYIKNQGTGSG